MLAVSAAAAITALPLAAVAASEPKAVMLYTPDEPGGVLVEGHVSDAEFNRAALALLNSDDDAMENAEDWFAEKVWTEDESDLVIKIKPHTEPERRYVRLVRAKHPEEQGEFLYHLCDATNPDARPVSVYLY